MTEQELLEAACDRGRRYDTDILLQLHSKCESNPHFVDALVDAVTDAGFDMVTYQGFIKDAVAQGEAKLLKRTTAVNGKVVSHKPLMLSYVSGVEEKDPDWGIKGYMPKRCLSLLGAPGGTGKTTVLCAVAAAYSAGKNSFLSKAPFETTPGKVLFLASEDSFEYTLRHRLERNGANLDNIAFIPVTDPNFSLIKFDSLELRQLLEMEHFDLVIFDPLQQFLAPNVNMAYRNAMRQAMTPLLEYGERYDTTFLISVHCNKKVTTSARASISDSSDIWDIARSVMMLGETEDPGTLYLSHEKCNVGPKSETVLLSFDDGKVVVKGRTDRRFKDYNAQNAQGVAAPIRNEIKELILDQLDDGRKKCEDVDAAMRAMGFKNVSINRAKADLKREKKIRYSKDGYGGSKWYMQKYVTEKN